MNWDKNNYSAQYSRTRSIKQLSKIKSSYQHVTYKKPIILTPQKSPDRSKSRSTITVKIKMNPECQSHSSSQISTKYSTNCVPERSQKSLCNKPAMNQIYERMFIVLNTYKNKEESWVRNKHNYENQIRKLEKRIHELQLARSTHSKSKLRF